MVISPLASSLLLFAFVIINQELFTMAESSPYFQSTDAADTTVEISFPESCNEPPRFGIGYWSIRGLGAPVTMMLCAAKKPFTLFLYDIVEKDDGWNSAYFGAKKEYIKDYKSPSWNLPFCVDRTEKMVVCQSNAIHSHVGRVCGFMGDDTFSVSKCEEFLCEIYDIRNIVVKFAYGGPVGDNDAEEAKGALKAAMGHFRKIESWLEIQAEGVAGPVVHLVKGKMSAPDFHLFEMLDQFEGFCDYYKLGDLYEKLPRLKTFKDGFAALPENQFYLKSWLYTDLAYNNCMARFGSLPGPKTYTHGESAKLATWRKKGTISMSPSSCN